MLQQLPNLICILRIALVWPVIATLRAGNYELAMLLFAVAAVSDGLDGYLAKRFHWTSELGKVLDPAADKLLLVTVFVTGSWLGLVPRWLTAAAVGRDLVIALGAGAYKLWIGPLHGRPTFPSKVNTLFQLGYLLAVMAAQAFGRPGPVVLTALALATLIMTLLSGADYVLTFARRAWAQPV